MRPLGFLFDYLKSCNLTSREDVGRKKGRIKLNIVRSDYSQISFGG